VATVWPWSSEFMTCCFRSALWRIVRKPIFGGQNSLQNGVLEIGQNRRGEKTNFRRFSNFLPDNFPFVCLVFFDSVEKGSTLFQVSLRKNRAFITTWTHFVLGELCIMHVLPRVSFSVE
jgi:hypothetical protein